MTNTTYTNTAASVPEPDELWAQHPDGPTRTGGPVVVAFNVSEDLREGGGLGSLRSAAASDCYWDVSGEERSRLDALEEAIDALEKKVGEILLATGAQIAPWAEWRLDDDPNSGENVWASETAVGWAEGTLNIELWERVWDSARCEVEKLEANLRAEFSDLDLKSR